MLILLSLSLQGTSSISLHLSSLVNNAVDSITIPSTAHSPQSSLDQMPPQNSISLQGFTLVTLNSRSSMAEQKTWGLGITDRERP